MIACAHHSQLSGFSGQLRVMAKIMEILLIAFVTKFVDTVPFWHSFLLNDEWCILQRNMV